jgi:hypothetical protein
VAHIDEKLSKASLIADRPRQTLSFTETAQAPLELSQRKEGRSQVEAKINGLLERFAVLAQKLEAR